MSLSKITNYMWGAGGQGAGTTTSRNRELGRQIERKLRLIFCHILSNSHRMIAMRFGLDFEPAGGQRNGAGWLFHKQGPRRWYPLINSCLGLTMLMELKRLTLLEKRQFQQTLVDRFRKDPEEGWGTELDAACWGLRQWVKGSHCWIKKNCAF